jgi:hypothetical protein
MAAQAFRMKAFNRSKQKSRPAGRLAGRECSGEWTDRRRVVTLLPRKIIQENPMKRFLLVILLVALALPALAQAPPAPPKPGPEQQKLAYFLGTWTSTADMKPGPFGPGGKASFTEHNEWFPGDFFLVTRSDGEMPGMGKMKGLATMGYDAGKKEYFYHAINSAGMAESATGRLDGDTWNWSSEMPFGGKVYKNRFTIKQKTPTSYDFKLESSEDGMNWAPVMAGTAHKAAAKSGSAAKPAPARGSTTETTTTTTKKTTTKSK